MADFRHSTAAPSANPIPFDPAAWLSHFESVGGGFVATDSQTSLCIAYQGTSAEARGIAHAMLRDLANDQQASVIAHIRERAEVPVAQPDVITAYWTAHDGHAAGTVSDDAYLDAFIRMSDYRPTTERDFIRKFIAMWKDGLFPNEDRIEAMVACGSRLVGDN